MIESMFPSAVLIRKLAESIVKPDESSAKDKSLEELSLAAKRQEIEMSMAREKARVAQELAIARRIELAEEVEIEEFYGLEGDASAGVKADETAVTLGVAASGKRVTKRVYKFRGFAAESEMQAAAEVVTR